MSDLTIETTGREKPRERASRRLARLLAGSPVLRHGRELWGKNIGNWNLPLTRTEKLQAGVYLLLKDYSEGIFPPTFTSQQEAYQNEINYRSAVPGLSETEVARNELTKPFWPGAAAQRYLGDFLKLLELFEAAGVKPPAKLLELGGGSGWMAEFLAQFGYRVISTTISPHDNQTAQARLAGLRAKGAPADAQFLVCPMETVADHVGAHAPFDAVFVYEALHHAFDWRAALESGYRCLRPAGWLLIANEPNILHTAVAYRVARLSHTHEIGFCKRRLIAHLRQTGFRSVRSFGKRPHFFFRAHWLLAQK